MKNDKPQNIDVTISANKDATKKVVQEAKDATLKVRKLIEDNHFTLTIVLGLTGKPKRKTNAAR